MTNDNRQAQPGLRSGAKLGPYEILAPIGAGGMGEVYQAKDTRLDRTVAIKVLPSHLAENPDLKQRFEREARAVSSLNHPHICTLYEFDTQVGTDFLVMEYIEGETLAEKLTKGALPLDKTLEYAIQIADGLDKAHRAGIVHRDLKPGNIMLTKLGIKILDFGLAKFQQETAESDNSEELTRQKPLTDAGSILGTVQYMAPEQLEGQEADVRTDIFAFGALLYQMLTGRRAFEGKSQASVITAIMSVDPPALCSLQPTTPPVLDWVTKRCLEKDPDERWQSAKDLTAHLKLIGEGGAQAGAPTPVAVTRTRRSRLMWGVAGLLVGAIATGFTVWSLVRPVSPPPTRLAVVVPEAHSLFRGGGLALSPDGRDLVYVGWGDDVGQLVWRSLDQLEGAPIPGTEGARYPFFSPDSKWIAFFTDRLLKKVSLAGGSSVTICDAVGARGSGSWGPNDNIVFSGFSGLFEVSASGGVPRAITSSENEASNYRDPDILPGGRAVLFTTGHSNADARIVAKSLETGEQRTLVDGIHPRYVPTGHIVFIREGLIWAVPFDLDRLELSGTPMPVLEGLQAGFLHSTRFAVSGDGSLVYFPEGSDENTRLIWVDRHGREILPVGPPGLYMNPELSPDEKQVAVHRIDPESENPDIWLIELEHDISTRFTFDRGTDLAFLWSPDGARIVFNSNRDGGVYKLYEKPTSGAGDAELLLDSNESIGPFDWSTDGRFIIYFRGSTRDIHVLPMFGDRRPFSFLETEFDEYQAKLSPNGRWIAYASDESGKNEIYVRGFPSAAGKWQVSIEGGVQPRWSGDGKELFYIAPGQRLMAVAVKGETELEIGTPTTLFETRMWSPTTIAGVRAQYDVADNGQRFLFNWRDRPATSQIHIVLNWFDELKRLVPAEN